MNCDRGQGRLLCNECCRAKIQIISLRMRFTVHGVGQDGNRMRQDSIQGRYNIRVRCDTRLS